MRIGTLGAPGSCPKRATSDRCRSEDHKNMNRSVILAFRALAYGSFLLLAGCPHDRNNTGGAAGNIGRAGGGGGLPAAGITGQGGGSGSAGATSAARSTGGAG